MVSDIESNIYLGFNHEDTCGSPISYLLVPCHVECMIGFCKKQSLLKLLFFGEYITETVLLFFMLFDFFSRGLSMGF